MTPPRTRMPAAERRRLVLRAAITEYGRTGLHETSTEAIAAAAGVSQPYLFRLFGTKTDLMIAAIEQHVQNLREMFAAAAARAVPADDPAAVLAEMGQEYCRLSTEDPWALRAQLHTWAAASDPHIGPVARRTYLEVVEDVRRLSGANEADVVAFMGYGMYRTVAAALELHDLVPPLSPKDD